MFHEPQTRRPLRQYLTVAFHELTFPTASSHRDGGSHLRAAHLNARGDVTVADDTRTVQAVERVISQRRRSGCVACNGCATPRTRSLRPRWTRDKHGLRIRGSGPPASALTLDLQLALSVYARRCSSVWCCFAPCRHGERALRALAITRRLKSVGRCGSDEQAKSDTRARGRGTITSFGTLRAQFALRDVADVTWLVSATLKAETKTRRPERGRRSLHLATRVTTRAVAECQRGGVWSEASG